VTPGAVQEWLDAYLEAWRTYDANAIAGLFTVDAVYAYNPWDEPIKGRETIVADWLTDQDAPGSWTAEYRPFVVAGNRAVAIGETRYVDDKVFFNIWQLTFDRDGRCSDFVEWYMTPPNDRQ
jgi:ketosteroid isomerase-like protein